MFDMIVEFMRYSRRELKRQNKKSQVIRRPAGKTNITTSFKADISDLKGKIQEANRNIKLANAEFKAAASSMDFMADSADGIQKKLEQLSKVYKAQNTILDSYKKELELIVKEQGENIIFLRKIIPGGADRSYGIQVARLAGVPESVLKRARELVDELSDADITARAKEIAKTEGKTAKAKTVKRPDEVDRGQMSLFGAVTDDAVVEEIKNLPLETMSPIEALTTLYRLQNDIRNRV